MIMKENNKQVVFYSAEKDGFLKSYKDKESLVFTAVFDDRLWQALQLPILDGSDFERTERKESTKDRIEELVRLLAK